MGVADRAGECWIAAEVKLGEERKKLPKAVGDEGTARWRQTRIRTRKEVNLAAP